MVAEVNPKGLTTDSREMGLSQQLDLEPQLEARSSLYYTAQGVASRPRICKALACVFYMYYLGCLRDR